MDLLGQGGMGEVWRARDELLGRTVALKLLLPGNSDPTAADRFRREAQTAARLNHPHVVAVYDAGVHDGRGFLVMELVDGHSLSQELAAHTALDPGQVASLAAQTANGLAAAHRMGVVHRDIKPGNLLLSADGTLKIGDFGIASILDDPSAALTATGQVLGTSVYLAPERALGRPAEPASDVYALGYVLYQLATGHPPFHADSTLGVVYQHVDALPTPPIQLRPELPGVLSDYLLRMLAKDPAARPTAQQAADWFAAQHRTADRVLPSTQPASAAPISKTTRMAALPPPRRRRTRRGVALAGVAGAVALGTAAVIGLSMNSGDEPASRGNGSTPGPSAPDPTPTHPGTPTTVTSAVTATATSQTPKETKVPAQKPAKKAPAKKAPADKP
ncbi:serine/threonine-protein kinase [Streptomyces griseofuscus]|uniref:serine/threonine-protein kinase n=1 Tax=Streptomyces griseofuscus TaxID=146922 RepID=UPI0033DD2CD5